MTSCDCSVFTQRSLQKKDQPTALLSDWKHRIAALIQKAVKLRLFKTWISNNNNKVIILSCKNFLQGTYRLYESTNCSASIAILPTRPSSAPFSLLCVLVVDLLRNLFKQKQKFRLKAEKKISGINFGQVKGKRNATLKCRYSSASHSKFAIFTFLCTAARGLSVLCDEALSFCLLKHDTFIVS